MTDAFGIDTQTSHLDLFSWAPFQQWNSGIVPAFAGRNFLGGDFIWVGAEATTALSSPQPDDILKVALLTPLIAPIRGRRRRASRSQTPLGFCMARSTGRLSAIESCRLFPRAS
jgi:hypothetical protein